MPEALKKEIKIFYCYAQEDQKLCEALARNLLSLKRLYSLEVWSDQHINPGTNWEETVHERLNTADLILLLVSPDFLASDHCYNKEMPRALERHQKKEARVIPILLHPTLWENTPFSHLQILPTGAKPITSWRSRSDAFLDIVKGIKNSIESPLLSSDSNTLSDSWQEQQAFSSYLPFPPDSSTLSGPWQKAHIQKSHKKFTLFTFIVLLTISYFLILFLFTTAIKPHLLPIITPGILPTIAPITITGQWSSSSEGNRFETWGLTQSGNTITGDGSVQIISKLSYSENLNGSIHGKIVNVTVTIVQYTIKYPLNVSVCNKYRLVLDTSMNVMRGYFTDCNNSNKSNIVFTRHT